MNGRSRPEERLQSPAKKTTNSVPREALYRSLVHRELRRAFERKVAEGVLEHDPVTDTYRRVR